MKKYTHLIEEERYYIFIALKSGKSVPQIAQDLGRNKTTIYREVSRNKGKNVIATSRHRQNTPKGRPSRLKSAYLMKFGVLFVHLLSKITVLSR